MVCCFEFNLQSLRNKILVNLFLCSACLKKKNTEHVKKLGAQDSEFAGTIDTNQLGFKCLYPRNAMYRFEQKLITQTILC